MKFDDKKILVYGMGISGRGAASLLKNTGAKLVLFDANEDIDKEALFAECGLSADTKLITGRLNENELSDIDVIVLSPGISAFCDDISMARKKGIEVVGEIELAYELSAGRMIAITGTNGKTTTTALTGEIMKAAFDDVYVVGNIGRSFAEIAQETGKDSVIVAEISSFQLETIKDFHPVVTAVLNITPDHLDRHGDMETYAATKMLIGKNQTPDERCVLNYDDEYLRRLSADITSEPFWFSRLHEIDKGICLRNGTIIYKDGNKTVNILRSDEVRLKGDHNIENIMAACAIALAMGVEADVIAETVKEFRAVEHRIEYVETKNGVEYFNDSKGTNTDAADKAVHAMTAPIILIAGGYDKGADFTDWIKGFDGKVKAMMLIGQTAEKIKNTAEKNGFSEVFMCGDLAGAVSLAAKTAEPGDCVLLSPACASWDQFKNYEERGRQFKALVRELPE